MINGWIIIGIVLLIATIVFAILANREKGIVFAVCTYIALLLTATTMITGLVGPIIVKRNIIYHKGLSLTVELAGPVVGYEDFVEPINKSNEWLTDAKKSLDTFGMFSLYYGSDINELEYIVIPEDE